MNGNSIVPLHTLAHARTGDKGNRCSISVVAFDPAHWDLLLQQVTEARVAELFSARRPTAVRRYVLPRLHAMNFVLDDVLDGGVNDSLNLDTHGKSLSSLLLTLTIHLPASPYQETSLGAAGEGPQLAGDRHAEGLE